MHPQQRGDRRTARDWTASAFVAAMLAADAGAHGNLARQAWDGWRPVTPAQLFGLEALAAAAAGLAVLVSNRRVIWAAASLVALGSLAAVLVTRYVNIPAIGPIPSMYEPVWYGKKTWSAIAEGLGGIVALMQLVALGRRAAAADRRHRDRRRILRTRAQKPLASSRQR